MTRLGALAGGTAAVCLGFVLVAGPAAAGPCTAKIAELEKQMSSPSGKEAGTMAGNAPNSMGKPVDPANGRATSPQDVRLQTAGEPTTAQGSNPKALDTHMSQAKAALDKAKSLDAKNDASCGSAVDQARDLMRKGK